MDKVSGTLGDLSRRRASKGGAGKGYVVKGISAACKKGVHTGCYSLTCTCSCGHKGKNSR